MTLEQDRQHYVAHYLPWQITGISGMSAGGSSSSAKTETGSLPLIVGTGVTVDVDYDANISDVSLPHSTIEVYSGDKAAVKAGTADLLAKREGEGDRDRNTAFDGGHAGIKVDPWPSGVETITAVAYTDNCEKHYYTINVETASGAAGLDLSYLTSPRNCRTSAADPDVTGPDIYGTAAFQNADTGEMELYVAGIGGVYQYVGSSGTTDFVRMAGMEDLNTAGDNLSMISCAFGIGGTADDLTTLVKVYHSLGGDQGGTVSYEVRWYDAEEGKWITKSTIPKDKTPGTNGGINEVLILSSDEIWTDKAYYNGTDWTLHGYTFNTFEKVNSTTAYATATNGKIYKLNTTRSDASDSWTEVDLGGKLLGSRYDGALAVKLTNGGYAILDADGTTSATYPEITPDIFGDVWTKDGVFKPKTDGSSIVHTVGFGGDGKVYALIQGSGRNYVVRADESGWTLMDTVEAFDIGGTIAEEKRPTTPTRIASLSEGVSLLYGDKGSLYLHAQDYTVTFNSNGGSAVSPISGQAWSSFIMPIPTQSGKTFAGWYTDAGLTKLYTNPVIPAANLTLYAKWTDASSDRWAEDRAKALKQLDNALARMDAKDYSEANWQRVLVEYENGKYAIAAADPQPADDSESEINKAVQDTIYAALNTAIDRMNAVPILNPPAIEVVVSMDAQTLGLGYMIKPTVVHTTKYTKASQIITDAIKQNIQEKYGLALNGYTVKHVSEPDEDYAYMNTGSISSDFYLAQVYWPDQTEAQIAQYILDVCGDQISETQVEHDKTGKYLGEFDYYTMSGWMYSISNIGDDDLPSFPGVGAAGWSMRDGEIMRWQFTVYGYGSDLNADNSEWGSASITGDSGDKTELTYKIAQMREDYKESSTDNTYKSGDDTLETSRIYMNVFDGVLCDPLANQAKLDAAVADLDLVAKELQYADELEAVTDKILEMGTVKEENGQLVKDDKVTAESGEKIAAASKAYDALTAEQKTLFGKAYPEYLEALENAKADKAAAAAVDSLIEAIGPADKVGSDSGLLIRKARSAYAKLTETQKKLVTKYADLLDCEIAYDQYQTAKEMQFNVTPATVTATNENGIIKLVGYLEQGQTWTISYQGKALTVENGKLTCNGISFTVDDTGVIVKPAAVEVEEAAPSIPEPDLSEIPEDRQSNVTQAAEEIKKSENTGSEGLGGAAAGKLIAEGQNKANKTEIEENQTVEVTAKPSLEIKVVDVVQDADKHILTLDITPQVVYTTTVKNTKTDAVVTETDSEPEKIANSDIKAPITISIPLPTGMSAENLYIKHYFSDREGFEFIRVLVEERDGVKIATWQQSSFSTVELLSDSRSASVSFGDEQVTLTPEGVGKELPTASKDGKIFTGWTFTVKNGDKTEEIGPVTQLTNDLLDKLSSADSVTATPNFRDQTITPVGPSKPSKPSTPDTGKNLPFTDVASGSWYEEAVKFVSEKGLMNGTSSSSFSPNATTTRGMIVTILARVEGVNTNGSPWYAAGRTWAMENGISDGTNMEGSITREQLAAILFRYAKMKGYDVSKTAVLTSFTDADQVSSYAVEAMQWATAEGLVQGSNGKLDPKGTATRAQVAMILMRFMEKYAK